MRLVAAQEGVPAPSKIHQLGVDMCLKFLDDSVPAEVREEALARLVGKGLQWFIRVIVLVSLLLEGFEYYIFFEDTNLSRTRHLNAGLHRGLGSDVICGLSS